jgi:hypothetical protein
MTVAEKIEELLGENAHVVGSDAVQAALVKHRQEQAEQASKAIVQVLASADSDIARFVADLRRLRNQEKKVKQHLAKLGRAVEFFQETGDPMPLCGVGVNIYPLLQIVGVDADPTAKVPDDWKPSK